MKNYNLWMNSGASFNETEDMIFDMVTKTDVNINYSNATYPCVINDANEWQTDIDSIILIHKSIASIKQGDIISFDNHDYIILYEVEDRNTYSSGKMRRCNEFLTWKEEGILYNYPCIAFKSNLVKTDIIGGGTEFGLSMLAGGLYVYIPKNNNTLTIKPNQRFILGRQVFEVAGFDDVTYPNIIVLTVELTLNRTSDDFINHIADNTPDNYTLTIINGNSINLGLNSISQLNVLVKNNEFIINDAEITYESSNTEVASVSSQGLITALSVGEVDITVNYKTTSNNVHCVIVDSAIDNYSVDIIGQFECKTNDVKSYVAKVFKNGIEVFDTVGSFMLQTTETINPTTIISSTTNQCKLKFGTVINNTVTLTFTLNDDDTVNISKQISIKGLW